MGDLRNRKRGEAINRRALVIGHVKRGDTRLIDYMKKAA
jgi:hypothetical protein